MELGSEFTSEKSSTQRQADQKHFFLFHFIPKILSHTNLTRVSVPSARIFRIPSRLSKQLFNSENSVPVNKKMILKRMKKQHNFILTIT